MNLKNNTVARFIKNYSIIPIVLVVFIASALIASPKFTNPANLYNLSQSIGTYGILAIGLTFIFIVGGIDLSIGYQVAFCGTSMVILANSIGLWPAVIITLLIGAIIGYINGTIVTRLRIPPLIGTLATMTALKGFVLAMNNNTGGQSVKDVTLAGKSLTTIYSLKLFGFLAPSLLVAIIILVAFGIFLKRTRPGINMYIVGGNPEAGILSGVNNNRLTRMAYAFGGFCASVCAILSVFRLNASTYNMGDNIDIIAICSVVVGGVKMSGGKGNMTMCILGVATIQIINNVMTKLGLHSSIQALVTGIVVILVLIADKYVSKEKKTA